MVRHPAQGRCRHQARAQEHRGGTAAGYYNNPSLDGKRPGIYWINLRDTAEVPNWTLPSVTYHECIPGHHLQSRCSRKRACR